MNLLNQPWTMIFFKDVSASSGSISGTVFHSSCAVLWYPLCCIMVSAVLYYVIRCAVLSYSLCCIMESAVLYYWIHCEVLWNLLCCNMESAVLYHGICFAVFCNPMCSIMESAVLYYGIRVLYFVIRCALLWHLLCCIMKCSILLLHSTW